MYDKFIHQLGYEFWQTETSASRHCRREARRWADSAPARALLAAAEHADRILAELPHLPLLRGARQSGLGRALGQAFSLGRDAVLDKLLTGERSYRGTLLGLRHGVDLVRLMNEVTQRAGIAELTPFLTRWLEERVPLVESVADNMRWFAERPERALESARGILSPRPANGT